MKRIFLSATMTVLFLSFALVASAAKPDFTGTWKLDAAKSSGVQPGIEVTMTVTQKDDKINTETKFKGGPQGDKTVSGSYVLDGKETDFTPKMQNDMTAKGKKTSKWNADGSGIEITEKVEMETPNGDTVQAESASKWSLSSDGKTLTIEGKSKTARGEQEYKRIFVKQ